MRKKRYDNPLMITERNLDDLNIFKYGYVSWKCLSNWPYNIKQFFRNIRYARQRATRGYCDVDVYSLNDYYLKIFYHTLKKLALTSHGWPTSWSKDKKKYSDWVLHLSEIADHFENAQCFNNTTKVNIEENEALERAMSLTDEEEYDKAMQEYDDIAQRAEEYRTNELEIGLDMLKQSFKDLFD